jgi:putative ABC transport system permease protein
MKLIRSMLRRFKAHPLTGSLNVAGLVTGMVCVLFIGLFVYRELTYDRFHSKGERIALLQQFEGSASSGGMLAPEFLKRFSQVEHAARLITLSPLVAAPGYAAYQKHFVVADSSVFSLFSLSLLEGDPRTALREQSGLVISKRMAQRYFKDKPALGQELLVDGKHRFHVTGVLADLPDNSHLRIDFLAPYQQANVLAGWDVTTNYWGGGPNTYLLLTHADAYKGLEAQFPAFISSLQDANAAIWKLKLIPLHDVYLRTSLYGSSPITYVYIFSLIGLFILSLACFNYVNLATAQSTQRAKETGVRKVLGASRGRLSIRYISETMLTVTTCLVLAIVLVMVLSPLFAEISGKTIDWTPLFSWRGLAVLIGFVVLLAVLAGFYPAVVLTAFEPARVLKGDRSGTGGQAWLRSMLVTIQFVVSIVMIIATFVVGVQLRYVRDKDAGYQRSQVLSLDLRDARPEQKALFQQEVKRLPAVVSATRAFSLPGNGSMMGMKLVSEYVPLGAENAGISRLTVDGDFLSTLDIKLLAGRMLDPNRPADKQAFLVNEAAMRYFGWTSIEGKMTGYYQFEYQPDGSYREVPVSGPVVGLIGDYHHASLKQAIEPMIISLNEGPEGQVAIKLKAGAIQQGIEDVQKQWAALFPGKPFEYQFLDESFQRTYQADAQTGKLFGVFAGIAVLISCLGLLGLVAHAIVSRQKELGIRRVLGADVQEIVRRLAGEFILPVVLAALIAFPVAWWAMASWLNNYAYRVDMPIWVFPLALSVIVIMAYLTVWIQAVRSAAIRPVAALRTIQ